MAFSVKQWFDRFGSGGSYDQPTDTGDVPDTPLDAAGQRDQETRLSAYTDSTLAAHTGAATGAHAASAVSFSPTGSVGSTNAQAAIAEVASEAASALTTGLAGKADLSGGHVPLAQLGSGTPASGKYVDGASGAWLPLPAQSGRAVGVTIDGGGSPITTGVKGYVHVPFTGTITGWTLLADVSGSAVVDVWKDTYANYPPTIADTITAAAKPTLSSATKATDTTLTGWTKSVTAGDVIGFNVDSASTVTRLALSLDITPA